MGPAFKKDKKIELELDEYYKKAKQDANFNRLVAKLGLTDKEARANVSKLETTIEDLKNSKKNHTLKNCPNTNPGYVMIPEKKEGLLYFSFVPCKCRMVEIKEMEAKQNLTHELDYVSMKDIDLKDKKRSHVIKWLGEFYKNYSYETSTKGLYLTGSFGSGKTFLIHALFNDLNKNKDVAIEYVYFPDLLRELKDDWELYGSRMERYQKIPLLLLDDIGAEKVTEWGRDEVLGTILQNRMNKKLPTFFTSNLTISELERHLAGSKNNIDIVKARRIIERIKQLSTEIELISENRRS